METQNFDYETGNRRLMRVFYCIGGLWVVLVPVLILWEPSIALYHHVWMGFLLANLSVWSMVFVGGVVTEALRGIRAARVSVKRARRERADGDVSAGRQLAMD